MKEFYRQIISGLTAGLFLILLLTFANWIFLFSLLVAGCIGIGVYFSIPRKKDDHEIYVADGITQAQLNEQLAKINTDMETFSNYLSHCQNRKIATAVSSIIEALAMIADNFRKNPKDIRDAWMSLNTYLDRTRDILARYMNITDLNIDPAYLQSIEQTILRIPELFQDYYRKCIEDDLVEMEISHELFKDILELETSTSTAERSFEEGKK